MENLENKIKLELPSFASSEGIARAVITAFISQACPSSDETLDIENAVFEAIQNCILYAYPDCFGKIFLTAVLKTKGSFQYLTITVRDKGIGIPDVKDAMKACTESLSGSYRRIGFTIMESFMDSITVKSTVGQGTTVIMKKIIGRA